MHRSIISLLLAAGSQAAAATTAPAPRLLRDVDVSLTLLVPDEDTAGDQLIDAAQRAGGYFRVREAQHIVSRVPESRLDAYLATVAKTGQLVERKMNARDITDERARTAAELASHEEMLTRYLANMSQTASHDDLAAAQAATSELVADIERTKGTLLLLDHNARYASVDISFKVRERRPVKVTHDAPFPWLGTINLNDLLADFASAPGTP